MPAPTGLHGVNRFYHFPEDKGVLSPVMQKSKYRNRTGWESWGRIVILTSLLWFVLLLSVQAQETADSTSAHASAPSWIEFHPFSTLTLRSYRLDTHYPALTYRLVNSDGDAIERGWTPFAALEGNLNAFGRLSASYVLQAGGTYPLGLKKGSVKISDFGVSLELARGTVWLGHGYHGSFQLSNNAEPFTLVKFQTEEPFSIPYIGEFEYLLFNAWPREFKLLAHRLTYKPVSWLEIGGTESVVYKRDYKFWEFFRILTAAESNVSSVYNNDMRASMDIAFDLSFLHDLISPLVGGKIYAEYAGEDLFAFWQEEDDKWVGPFGFEFLDAASMFGLVLRTERQELRVEYSQNYRNVSLFHDFKGQFGYSLFTYKWYGGTSGGGNPHFENGGAAMGHHMGNAADDLFFEFTQQLDDLSLVFSYNKQRRGLVDPTIQPWRQLRDEPELFTQLGLQASYSIEGHTVSGVMLWHDYKNASLTGDPLNVVPTPRRDAREMVLGLSVSLDLSKTLPALW